MTTSQAFQPASVRVQREIHGHLLAIVALDLGAYGRLRIRRIAPVRQDDEFIGREVDQRLAIIAQQRVIESVDEALALLRGGAAPGLPQHEPGRVFAVEARHQHIGYQRIELGPVLRIHRAVGIEFLEHFLRRILDDFLRARARHRSIRGRCRQDGKGRQRERGSEDEGFDHFDFSGAAGASVLDAAEFLVKFARNWPIRFSSTNADCVKSI